jgi:molybdopterin-containing oxidoreductase family membrane subunit
MITFNGIVPHLLWFKRIRENLNYFFVISIIVNIGMWYERFVIIVPSLAHSYMPWQMVNYHMSWVEAGILMGSFGWFFMWFLLFLRFLPGLSIAEIKEVLPPPMRGPRETRLHAQQVPEQPAPAAAHLKRAQGE